MPSTSQAQRAYLNMKFGHAWVREHGFANKGKLPAHARKRKKKRHVTTGKTRHPLTRSMIERGQL